ncbi:MAG: hypothetical protein ABW043_12325 [Devosia sp.]|uniref:hypothetical protein n=1 Tax=Devosia sp. TaxID=1871048 RepID=UPI00339843A7
MPINLQTPEKTRELGWQAEARDSDGHLVSCHAPFDGDEDIVWYIRESMDQKLTVTIWPGFIP